MSCSVSGIQHTDVERWWALVEGHLIPAIDRSDGRYSSETVKNSCIHRDMQLWIIHDENILGALVTSVIPYPLKTVCSLMFCGGSRMRDWVDNISVIEDWAKDNGCESMEIPGREGWGKVLDGYNKIHVVLRKNL